jgi:excisionase family DNA binding protein
MENVILLKESDLRRIIADVMAEKPQEEKTPEEQLLTTNEACEFLRCSKPTLHRWKKEGIVPHVRIGANIRYRKSDLQKIAEK